MGFAEGMATLQERDGLLPGGQWEAALSSFLARISGQDDRNGPSARLGRRFRRILWTSNASVSSWGHIIFLLDLGAHHFPASNLGHFGHHPAGL